MSRLTISILAFILIIGIADLQGWGHGYIILLLLGAWFLIASRFSSEAWQRLFTTALALSIGIAALAILQLRFASRPHSVFTSPNFLAGYAVLHLCLAWHLERSKFNVLALLANTLSLTVAQGRGAYLAAGAAILALFGRRYPLRALAGGALCGGAALYEYFTRMYGVPEPRINLILLGLNLAKQRLLLGWGQQGVVMWGGGGTAWGYFYNTPIQWLVAGGVLGLGAGAWIIYEGLRASRSAPAMTALLVAWVVNGLFIFDTAATTVPLFTALAYLESEQRREQHRAGAIHDHQPLLDRGV